MKKFSYIAAKTVEEASTLLKNDKTVLIAGGTDLLGVLKADLLPQYPETVVSLKDIPNLDFIEDRKDGLHIGARATLSDIAKSPIVTNKWQALADSAYSVASPNIRTTATIAGNIMQDIRCWYYRYPNSIGGRIDCARKEGHLCYAMEGENRYHSIFGAAKVCETPCTLSCPAHTDIASYMEELRQGNVDKAARIIMEVNPMPAITSRVCAHFCMEGCNRNTYDESLNVGAVERYLGDYILDNKDQYMKAPLTENGKKVAIIGSGPSGLTAAFYLRQAGYQVKVFERQKEAGGCLTYAIPAYRLPKEVVKNFVAGLTNMGVEIECETNIGTDKSLETIKTEYDSVLLNTGTWKRPLIGLAGEELTRFGLDFLVDVNSYILSKPGAKVVVVGGGNVAMDVAITAKRLGSESVKMVCLEQRDNMPANLEEITRALEEDVEILNGWGPTDILKDENNQVNGISFKCCTRSHDENGRFSPIYDENNIMSLDADVILMAVGQQADLSYLEGAYSVETQRGRIVVTDDYRTNVPGIFAAGDLTTGPATVIKAIAAGKTTAISINQYCGGHELPVEVVERTRERKDEKTFNGECVKAKEMLQAALLPKDERDVSKEDIAGVSKDDALTEANRCFNCGCLAVNSSDVANMLVAYRAMIKTNYRTMSAKELLTQKTRVTDVLFKGEIVTEIIVPQPKAGQVAVYDKYRTRKSIDFAILAVASVYNVEDGKITDASLVLGACAPVPRICKEAEEYLIGKELTDEVKNEAAALALKGAIPLAHNEYKIDMAKVMVKKSLEL